MHAQIQGTADCLEAQACWKVLSWDPVPAQPTGELTGASCDLSWVGGCCPGGLGLKLAAIFCLKFCSCFASLCTTGLARTLEPFPGSSHENSYKKKKKLLLHFNQTQSPSDDPDGLSLYQAVWPKSRRQTAGPGLP